MDCLHIFSQISDQKNYLQLVYYNQIIQGQGQGQTIASSSCKMHSARKCQPSPIKTAADDTRTMDGIQYCIIILKNQVRIMLIITILCAGIIKLQIMGLLQDQFCKTCFARLTQHSTATFPPLDSYIYIAYRFKSKPKTYPYLPQDTHQTLLHIPFELQPSSSRYKDDIHKDYFCAVTQLEE